MDESMEATAQRPVQVVFHGQADEYFRIWIVNVLLSIVTLGVYSAWAKVRTKRYFYGNTELDGHRFSYLADPVRILRGRIIAVLALGAYFLTWQFWPSAGLYALTALVLSLPAVLVMSIGFNMRNTAYRNIRFSFSRDLAGAYQMVAIPVLLVLALTWLFYLAWAGSEVARELEALGGSNSDVLLGIFIIVLAPCLPWLDCLRIRFTARNTAFGGQPMGLRVGVSSFYGIWFRAGLLSIGASLVMFVCLLMVGMIGAAGGMLNEGSQTTVIAVMTVVTVLVFYAMLFFVGAFMRARKTNLVMNALEIGRTRVHSTLGARELGWIYLSNTVAIVLTLGMAIPWAKIRAARYVASRTNVILVDIERIVAQDDTDRAAVGEELGDFFGFDFGL